ncbi:MAG TPA: hypothetical protein ENI60_06520 [Candidatus Fraserbacteria bacterium]|nr:hypothetical protein [Candidatus Fraserbacteria bacterium]
MRDRFRKVQARWRPLALLFGALLSLVALSGCNLIGLVTGPVLGTLDLGNADASQTFTQNIPYSGQRIVLENLVGSITIESWGKAGFVVLRPTLLIQAEKKVRGLPLDKIKIIVEQSANEIHIRTEGPSEMGVGHFELLPPRLLADRLGWVDYTLKVPVGATLDLEQQIGRVTVSGLSGRLTADIQVGTLTVSGVRLETAELSSEAGDLQLQDSSVGQAQLSTQAGQLVVERSTFSRARLETQAGDVRLRQVAFKERGTVSSQMGSIRLDTVSGPSVSADTQLGSIAVRLLSSRSVSIEAQTQLGGITFWAFDPSTHAQRSSNWPGASLSVRLGEGRDRLTLSTQMGGISIRVQPKQ